MALDYGQGFRPFTSQNSGNSPENCHHDNKHCRQKGFVGSSASVRLNQSTGCSNTHKNRLQLPYRWGFGGLPRFWEANGRNPEPKSRAIAFQHHFSCRIQKTLIYGSKDSYYHPLNTYLNILGAACSFVPIPRGILKLPQTSIWSL